MSARCSGRVWQDSRHKGGDLLVLLAIADHAKDDGSGAWPSLESLAAKTRLSERNVRYSLRKLEASGELLVERNLGPHGTNLYSVTLGGKDCPPYRETEGQRLQGAKIAGGQFATQEGGNLQQLGGQPIAPEPSLTVIEPSEEKKTKRAREKVVPFHAPAAVPTQLQGFDAILHESGNGHYDPTDAFYSKVADKYGALDLEEEALKLTSWLKTEKAKKKNRTCNTAFILNWLKNAMEDRSGSNKHDFSGSQAAAGAERGSTSHPVGVGEISPFAKFGNAAS